MEFAKRQNRGVSQEAGTYQGLSWVCRIATLRPCCWRPAAHSYRHQIEYHELYWMTGARRNLSRATHIHAILCRAARISPGF